MFGQIDSIFSKYVDDLSTNLKILIRKLNKWVICVIHPIMIKPFSVTWPSNKTTITELSGSTFQCQHTWIYLLNVPWNYLNRWYCVLLNSTQVYSGFYNLSVQLVLFNIRIPINKSQPIFFILSFLLILSE